MTKLEARKHVMRVTAYFLEQLLAEKRLERHGMAPAEVQAIRGSIRELRHELVVRGTPTEHWAESDDVWKYRQGVKP